VSGPVDIEDAAPEPGTDASSGAPCVEITPSHEATVGSFTVRRALPRRGRRTVGPWCFADHMGPASVTEDEGIDIGPHPHIGLQTVTWLLAGEVLHRDSLGSEQVIRPGQLNLMTAGRGVSHSEEHTGRYRGDLHGVQLWLAQPEATRHGEPAFAHHPELPRLELGTAEATVLAGSVGGLESPARRDTDHVGASLDLRAGRTALPVQAAHEHAVVVLAGVVEIDGQAVGPGHLAYLGAGRDELALGAGDRAVALLIGGVPFESPVLMWWNFVARTREEVDEAYRDWAGASGRFGKVASPLAPIPTGPPPWWSGR
jgi:redox-sensitive bicupin YhaK (pirin superfamily)